MQIHLTKHNFITKKSAKVHQGFMNTKDYIKGFQNTKDYIIRILLSIPWTKHLSKIVHQAWFCSFPWIAFPFPTPLDKQDPTQLYENHKVFVMVLMVVMALMFVIAVMVVLVDLEVGLL